MKTYKAILYIACGVMAMGSVLTSCQLEPYEIPAEEMYLRNFIKKYGLIDPTQDWNMSTPSEVKVVVGEKIKSLDVYALCAGEYYRVAEYADVDDTVTIPIDIPDGTEEIMVKADGRTMHTTPGGTVNFAMATSRAVDQSQQFDYENMAWLMVCEDLGATDDFDFNDIIIRVECITVNTKIYNQQWQVVTDDSQHPVLGAPRRDADSRANSESAYKRIRVTAMCAGGTLPLYLHFYDTSDNKDYIIGHGKNNSTIKNEASLTETSDSYFNNCEWHKWFGIDDYRIMINTGVNRDTGEPTTTVSKDQLVPVEFYVGADFKMSEYSKFVDYDSYLAAILKGEQIDESWAWANSPDDYMIQGFYVTVGGPTLKTCQTPLYAPAPGAAPQMFLIPDVGANGNGWEWPTERTNIINVYNNFTQWAKSGGETTDQNVLNWYRSMKSGLSTNDYCPRE